MPIKERLQSDLKEALRLRDETKVSTIRFLLAATHNLQIEQGKLSEEDIISVIQKQIKQRKESIAAFKQGGRDELVQKETREMEILQEYLPEQVSDAEIEILVDKTIKDTSASSLNDMGKVMGILSAQLKGKADMSTVSGLVRKKLS